MPRSKNGALNLVPGWLNYITSTIVRTLGSMVLAFGVRIARSGKLQVFIPPARLSWFQLSF